MADLGGDAEGVEWSAALAPELDRLALCIHRPTGRRPELMSTLGSLGLPPQSFVVSAARALAAGRLSVDDLALLGRYQPREWAEISIRRHLKRGLLVASADGASFVPSDAFRAAAELVLELQGEEAAGLWGHRPELLDQALELATAHVQVAASSVDALLAFRQQVRTHHVVPASPAAQLLGRLTELRYLRSDAHAACLAEANLTGPPAGVLHRLWRGFDPGPTDPSWLAALHEGALVTQAAHGWAASPAGIAVMERVEAATDSRFALLLVDVPESKRHSFLRLLIGLEGTDPRPREDR